MKKKMTPWEWIRYYQIIPLMITGIILFFAKDYVFDFAVELTGMTDRDRLYDPLKIGTYACLLVFWLWFCFTQIRNQRYRYLTGRSYGYDSGHYKPYTYNQLVDYFKDADPHKLDVSGFPETSWKDYRGLIFGRSGNHLIAVPSETETNVMVYGPPGSGKTSGIAIINALQFKGSVLAVDIKGDIYNYCKGKRKIVRFCPDAPNAVHISARFDPFRGIKEMDPVERNLYISSMAQTLIPDEGGENGNYFTSRARRYFIGICQMVLFENPDATFTDFKYQMINGDAFTWVKKACDPANKCQEARNQLASFYGSNEKNISGAYDALINAIQPFCNPLLDVLLSSGGTQITPDLLENGTDIYLQIAQEHLNVYAPVFTMIIQAFSMAFTKRPDSSTEKGRKQRSILFLMDEFPALSFSYSMISLNLSTLRSRRIICMLLAQSTAQYRMKYNSQDGFLSLMANTNYQVILGSNDPTSSKMFSDFFGRKKVLRENYSLSQSVNQSNSRSVSQAEEPVYPPEVFQDLGADEVIYFKGKHCRCKKINCYKDT